MQGYEFKAVVEGQSPFRQKAVTVDKTCKKWPSLVRDVDALVLFANGFGVLQLLSDTGMCQMWRRVPRGRDYMAASIEILEDLYALAGCK
jgi:hypothetical protein